MSSGFWELGGCENVEFCPPLPPVVGKNGYFMPTLARYSQKRLNTANPDETGNDIMPHQSDGA